MGNNKRDFFIATINREEEKEIPQKQPVTNSPLDNDEYFVSPSGKHPQKTIIPAIKGTNGSTKFEYLRGKITIDVNQYSVQAKNKETSSYRTESTYHGLEETNQPKRVDLSDNLNKEKLNEEEIIIDYDDQDVEEINSEIEEKREDSFFDEYETDKQPVISPVKEEKSPMVEVVNQARPKRRKICKIPPFDFLPVSNGKPAADEDWIREKAMIITKTFEEFNFKAEVVDKIIGPTVTQFLVKLSAGVNVNAIYKFENNIELNLGLGEDAKIRILTRVPNTTYAGIEVPNPKRQVVHLGDMIRCKEFTQDNGRLPIAVGLDVSGKKVYVDLTEMPHCLIAGTTKSGKSIALNTIIISLLYQFSPEYLRFVLIDPKRVELSSYEGIPHLAMPVITDFDDLKPALTWIVNEMKRRYTELSLYHQRNIAGLNRVLKERNQPIMPYLVFIMDEFAAWVLDGGIEVANMIQRLAQEARAAGIHMILAAQRPSNDVIKGSIKANFDTRFAFKVSSFDDSKVIIGGSGAERLVGRGDLLLKYMGGDPRRIQAAFIDDDNGDISRVVDYYRDEYGSDYLIDLEDLRRISHATNQNNEDESFYDERLPEVARFIVNSQVGSSQSVSIHFKMGFPRTNKIFMELERLGIVSPAVKGKPRDVLVGPETLERILEEEKLI